MKALSFDAYTLKWIAIVAMIANHVAFGFSSVLPFGILIVLYAVGGATYVIMAFFVVEGYKHTSNLKKYMGRLLLFGLIAQAFHPMVLGSSAMVDIGIFLNIMFTIILSLFVLLMYDKIKIRFLFWVLFIVACFVSFFMDLFFTGVLIPLLYYTIKRENLRRVLPGVIIGVFWLMFGGLTSIMPLMYLLTGEFAEGVYMAADMTGMTIELMAVLPSFAIGCFIGAFLLRNYNGDRGKPAKWLFYVVYPLHLAIIAAVMVAMGLVSFNLFGVI
ncbi:MAG: conjugal transfer protein TraX [Defluviitaleaceae bacterium]|nr:conjugal transfer protein TraX [Defluviitaleaceae bacterium]